MKKALISVGFAGLTLAVLFVTLGPPPWAPKLGFCPVPQSATAKISAPSPENTSTPSAGRANTGTAAVVSGLRRLEVSFKDIPCPGHVRSVLDSMELVEGVRKSRVFYSESTGWVDYDPAKVNPEVILSRMPPDCPAEMLSDRPRT